LIREEQQEIATAIFIATSHANPYGFGSETMVVRFSTNSTEQLAFLDNMLAIGEFEFSTVGGTIRTWEWRAGRFAFEADASAPIIGNQTAITR
jgi:hypothetical protein